jgi:hypothetical protein
MPDAGGTVEIASQNGPIAIGNDLAPTPFPPFLGPLQAAPTPLVGQRKAT